MLNFTTLCLIKIFRFPQSFVRQFSRLSVILSIFMLKCVCTLIMTRHKSFLLLSDSLLSITQTHTHTHTALSTGTGPDCIALILEQSDLGLQCYDQCLQLLCFFFFFFFLLLFLELV